MKQFVKFLVAFVLMAACEREETRPANTGLGYFPLKKGIFQVYSVNEITHSAVVGPENVTYELMTEVVDSFSTADGNLYVISRSRRNSEMEPWEPLDTWSARQTSRQTVISEGNTPFLKAIFPIREGSRWDGNTFNTLGTDEYEFVNAGAPFDVSGMTFENTLTVEQEHNQDFIVFNDARHEVYALEVGLVYREITQLNYCTDDPCLGQQKIESGMEMKQVIKQYGKR